MRTKMTNTQKILKVLKSGPKTQADLLRETKVKNTYQIVADLKKKGVVFMDSGKYVNLHAVGSAKTIETPTAKAKAEAEADAKTEDAVDRIAMLKYEIDNITDGIRSLVITRSYLMRRVQEEQKDV